MNAPDQLTAAIPFERLKREVEDMHAALAVWMGPGGEESLMARVEASFAPDFAMTGPDGRRRSKPEMLAMLRSRRAAYGRDFSIWIVNAVPIVLGGGFGGIGYDEIQGGRTGPTHRRASAVFRQHPSGPLGLHWIAAQETWISLE